MKFFWKIFFAFTSLITIAFSVFGILMVTQSFRTSMEREIEEGDRENRMFQLAFEVNMNALSDNYRTEKIVRDLAESVVSNLNPEEYSYKLYRGKKNLIYENTEYRPEHDLIEQMGDNDCVYQVLEDGEKRYLVFVCKSIMNERVYYLESVQDITEIYQDRDSFYGQYRVLMVALIIISSVVIFIVSHFLTRSVVNLSEITKEFADGDYMVRADVVSDDEIGTLAQDFNIMADNLNQKMDELTEAARKQEDFTASFAHELKTPLTSIIGYADMLRTMDMEKEETMEAANYIYSQGKRLESLSFKLLELIVTRNQEYRFKMVSVKTLLEEIQMITATSLAQKEINCYVTAQEGCVLGERDLLVSLFVNLVDNARKALQRGGNIWISGRNVEDGYEVAVQDNGCGMPQSEIDKITEAFYMVDKSRSRKEGGAGLGMTLCSRIVEVHNARWYIKSEVGKGTKIRVVFPQGEVPDEI